MNADAIHREVSRHFSNRSSQTAVAIPARERYTPDELKDLPADAVFCSDGCGNPLRYTQLKPGDRVLDLGSGAGLDLILASRRTGPTGSVVGVEMTGSMIALARANVERAGLTNVEVREGLIEQLPIESASVDWVISNCVINLASDKRKVFDEVRRVLKPGGRMLISDTVVGELPSWFRGLGSRFSPLAAVLLDEQRYLGVLAASGLESIDVKERTLFSGPRLRKLLVAEAGRFQQRDGAGWREAVAATERACLWPALFLAEQVLGERVSSIKVFAQRPQ